MKNLIFFATLSVLLLAGFEKVHATSKSEKLSNLQKYDQFIDFVHKDIKTTRKYLEDCEGVDFLKYYLLGRLECLYDASFLLEGFSPEHFKSLPIDQQRYIFNKLDQME